MRIAVVSDTHLPRFGVALPRALTTALLDARLDLIVHCGDWTEPQIPALFEAIAPLEAVAGNNDGPELTARFGRRRILSVAGVRIGVTHGDLGLGATTPERARRTFAAPGGADDERVDAIFFGHSHQPLIARPPRGPWLINPGSPTDKRRELRYSWAFVEVVDGEIRPELRFFDDRRP
jgi:uncharacterized protein